MPDSERSHSADFCVTQLGNRQLLHFVAFLELAVVTMF
ncbi:hypothetical protein PLEI_1637 [Photobacterium leiognathi lrivu.4.1]|uniref:Uncharacterized protein n=1 Tax=Photobacterium leiognathi lrivu.4.1 TaxID=1248232 RepID=A0A0U1P677_PHOLE|nr:hypothetical protein PLEI_1637 [Photobacterium leiognathi lrivu.4.1]